MKASELAKVKDNMLVSDFQGRVEKVFPQEAFSYEWEKKKIEGKKQNIYIDGVLVEIKDREPYEDDIIGKEIEILSTFNDKRQQWYGMKKSSFKNKAGETVLKISVTPSADIKIAGDEEVKEKEVIKTNTQISKPAVIGLDKDLFIARQACLKVSAEFSKGRDYIKSPTEIVEIAKIFLSYVCGADKQPDDLQDVKELESAENCENVGDDDEQIPF
jgi:hypothetical protein